MRVLDIHLPLVARVWPRARVDDEVVLRRKPAASDERPATALGDRVSCTAGRYLRRMKDLRGRAATARETDGVGVEVLGGTA